VVTIWLLSFNLISENNRLVADFLKFMCFLAEKDIPLSLLPHPNDELEVAEAIGMLKVYSFITEREESDTYDIHRQVRLVMLNWLTEKGELQEWTTKVLRQLADVFPFPKYVNRGIWMRYLPHTRYVLELPKNADDEKAEHDLLFNIGASLDSLGQYEEAEQMHRQALESREKALGLEYPDTLASVTYLGSVLQRQGKYEETEVMYRRALEGSEKVLGPEHPESLRRRLSII
jgi:tetratricopeptide (TPR) repeat protein